MFDDPVQMFLAMFAAMLIFCGGWIAAHGTIATECERLGAFYVGSKTFACEVKK